MHRWVRGGLVAVGVVIAAIAVHLAVLQAWAGPYPLSSRWWDGGYALMVLVLGLVVAMAATGIGDERAGAWLRDRAVADTGRARRYVRRWVALTRTCRAVGFVGVVLLPGVAGWSINTAGLPVGSDVRERLLELAGGGLFGLDGWSPAILGYAVGALAAEALRRHPPGAASDHRQADLRPRVPAAYMQPLARWGPRVLGGVALLVAAATAISGAGVAPAHTAAVRQAVGGFSSTRLALAVVVAVGATEVLRWAVVRHRQRGVDAEAIALDDAARATTIHAVSGSAIAIIGESLGQHLWTIAPDLSGPLWWLAPAGGVVSLVSLGVWLGYGVGLAWIVRRGPRHGPFPLESSR